MFLSLTIILVDDDPSILATFREPLQSLCLHPLFLLHRHQSAEELAEEILANGADVALMDEQLGDGVRGHAVVRILKKRRSSMQCIGFSSDSNCQPAFREAGADGFVRKDAGDPSGTMRQVGDILGE